MTELADRESTELREATPLDKIEAALLKHPVVDMPLVHRFTPGLYLREIHIPAGTMVSSMRHLTKHPFVILKGRIAVISDFERIIYEAPHVGITAPGTKRLLYAETDTVWLTCHANPENLTDPDEIVGEITEENDNPLVSSEEQEQANQWRMDRSPSLVITEAGRLTTTKEK